LWYIDIYKKKCENDLSILSYCILPNHFHLVVHNISDGHRLSYFIGNICAAYARYYKAKYSKEKGKKYFECRFKAKEILDEEYLQQCIQYVEKNPLKHGLVDNTKDWLFRSENLHNRACLPQVGANIENIDWERDF
jgi:REP element-mobilizing transposase RayT